MSAWSKLEELPQLPARSISTPDEKAIFNKAVAAMVEDRTEQSRQLLTPLAADGVTEAQIALGGLLSQSALDEERKEGLMWMYHAARAGVWHAQLAVGKAYREGKLVPQDVVLARTWLNQALVKGGEDVLEELDALNRDSIQAGIDAVNESRFHQAEMLLKPVAEAGLPRAQVLLANIYKQGYLGKDKVKSAQYWYERAATLGDRAAQYSLAMSYLNDKSMGASEKQKAVALLESAANPGEAEAQYQLGMLYLQGQYLKRDDSKGIHWYRLAAEQGHIDAQYSLGVRYTLGQGADKNEHEAHYWFKKAADQGNAKAEHNLALTYLHGLGTDKNPELAKQWFNAALKDGVTKASTYLDQFDNTKEIVAENTPVTAIKAEQQRSPKQNTILPVKGWKWFSKLPSEGYTIQLMYGLKEASIYNFIEDHHLQQSNYLYYVVNRPDEKHHILQYGYFQTLEEAQREAERVSHNYRDFQPWIRQVEKIRTNIERHKQG